MTTPNYSINRFAGDGSTTSFELNFAGGYILREHVKATTIHDDTGVEAEVSLLWLGQNTVSVTPPVAVGYTLKVYRDTPKSGPVVDFTDGAIINEPNLDTLAKQAIFVAAEVVDSFGTTATSAEDALALAIEAKAAADIAGPKADTALATANDAQTTADEVRSEFDVLLAAVDGIVGGDFSTLAAKGGNNVFSGLNRFIEPVKLGTDSDFIEFRKDGFVRFTVANVAGSWINLQAPAYANVTGKPSVFASDIASVAGLTSALADKATVAAVADKADAAATTAALALKADASTVSGFALAIRRAKALAINIGNT